VVRFSREEKNAASMRHTCIIEEESISALRQRSRRGGARARVQSRAQIGAHARRIAGPITSRRLLRRSGASERAVVRLAAA